MEHDTVAVAICERQLISNWLSLNFHCALYSKHSIGSKDALCFDLHSIEQLHDALQNRELKPLWIFFLYKEFIFNKIAEEIVV